MKTMDLNAYGVSEMNENEMEIVDGGWILIAALIVAGLLVSQSAY